MFKIFKKYSELVVAISQIKDGNMKFMGNPEADEEAVRNRKKFLEKLKIPYRRTIKIVPQHGANVKKVSLWQARKIIKGIDGLITNKKGVFLTITAADCLPVFLWDSEKEAIGLVHCGWQGLAKNILGNVAGEMIDMFNSYQENLLVGIGPGIGPCHFEVKTDVLKEFNSYLSTTVIRREGKSFLDLKKLAYLQLREVGVREENIEVNPECTFCFKEKYFSYRRSGGKPESMMAIFGKRS